MTPEGELACHIMVTKVIAIREAGAAGFALFPSTAGACALPLDIYQAINTGDPKRIDIANVSLSNKEGLKLRARLASEPVSVRVTGTPQTPYSYFLKPYAEGSVPKSLHYTLTAKNLAQIDMDIHASKPTGHNNWRMLYKQDDVVTTVTATSMWSPVAFTSPSTRTDYVGPLDPAVIDSHGMSSTSVDGTVPGETRFSTEKRDRPGRTRQQWFTAGLTPGAWTASDKVYATADKDAPPATTLGLQLLCVICVHGDTLWAEVGMAGTNDKQPVSTAFWSSLPATPDFDVHLYRDGTEITNVKRPYLDKLPMFSLPEGSGTYRLTAKNAAHDAEWTFKAPPAEKTALPGMSCGIWHYAQTYLPCRPTPAVFAGYDLDDSLSIDNTVPAGRSHKFTVEAYHSPSPVKMPKIAGLKLWMSTDDGAKWTSVKVKRDRDGAYTASTHYPSLRDTKGAVSLKVEAWDADGNTLKQTSTRLFNLR